jgi:hypothetical protein
MTKLLYHFPLLEILYNKGAEPSKYLATHDKLSKHQMSLPD